MDTVIHQSLDGTWRLAVIHHQDFCGMKAPVNYDEVVSRKAAVPQAKALIIDAEVPGNFEIDMERAGIIEDPFFGANVLKMFQWEDCHVIYTRKFSFTAEAGKKPELVFEGIDTVADIYLNSVFLGHTENMFITHRFDAALRNGENELVVHIHPACIAARKHKSSAGNYHLKYNYESLRLRKAPSMFGWDITPRLVSAGLFRPAGIYLRPQESLR